MVTLKQLDVILHAELEGLVWNREEKIRKIMKEAYYDSFECRPEGKKIERTVTLGPFTVSTCGRLYP